MEKSKSLLSKVVKFIAFVFNFYCILVGMALMHKQPESSIAASLICDVFNFFVYKFLEKRIYNHYSYCKTKLSDRALIRTMAVSAVMFPCSLLSRPSYFAVAVVVLSLFLPTQSQLESMLKCDRWSLVRKAKEKAEAKK